MVFEGCSGVFGVLRTALVYNSSYNGFVRGGFRFFEPFLGALRGFVECSGL